MLYRSSVCAIVIISVILSAFFIANPNHTYALSCAEVALAEEAFDRSAAVFSGRVTENNSYTYTFEVDEVYKGSPNHTVKLKGSHWDEEYFDTNERLLIYAQEKNLTSYTIGLCGRSGNFSDLKEDVQGMTSTTPEPDPFLSAPIWASIFIAGAGLSLLLFKRIRKKG
ncbi:hypothetical protein [Alkalicoccobacillus porphyridii]|uniref:Uncharacterized protein n=1 Tax=Alkalicoccobacillus porphyridii TaxID=2597270 RepID=A0A554A1V6_9BACI|nr:hypothetical protein [Alkalicoccobacillus porphyridii]TSB47659.1 hypothetical protein FN960_03820 [Alkalicoccobacillus porphyridii]